jgi:hypothetical protein
LLQNVGRANGQVPWQVPYSDGSLKGGRVPRKRTIVTEIQGRVATTARHARKGNFQRRPVCADFCRQRHAVVVSQTKCH